MQLDGQKPAANDGPAFTLTARQLEELVERAVRQALKSGSMAPVLVDKQDLARSLGCSSKHIDHLRQRGLPSVMLGKAVRFEPAKVVDWLREHGAEHSGASEGA